MRARTRDIDSGIPAGVKKWAEERLSELRALREDTRQVKLSKHFNFSGFEIQMWDHEFGDFLRIKGCNDRNGFLLTFFDQADPLPDFEAHYKPAGGMGAVNEFINPLDGLPRPIPDPATPKRTKGYVLPQQLRGNTATNTNAGKFSGLMRKVVGCYHIHGREAPFGFSHTRTHGITKLGTKHWVTEISAAGVFMAPVKNTGCCGDSFIVTSYQPTEAEIAANPSLQAHVDLLSLEWAFSVMRPNVVQVIIAVGMAGPYDAGESRLREDFGWAFPVHGREAQQVSYHDAGSGFTARTEWSRWKLVFSLVDGVPEAVLTQPDVDAPATFLIDSTLWFPTSNDNWDRFAGVTHTSQNVINFPTQDAPVHVYYKGDTEIVTRWRLVREMAPKTIVPQPTPEQIMSGNDTPYNGSGLGLFRAESGDTMIIYEGGTFTVTQAPGIGGPFLQLTAGFISPNVTGQFVERVVNIDHLEFPTGSQFTEVVPNSPPFGGDIIIVSQQVSQIRTFDTSTQTGEASFVTFIEDRESALHVYRQLISNDRFIHQRMPIWHSAGSYITFSPGVSNVVSRFREDLGTFDTFPGLLGSGLGEVITGETGPVLFPDEGTIVEERTGTGKLNTGIVAATVDLPQGSAPMWIIPANELMPFITDFDPAMSNVFAMHGNVHYRGTGAGPAELSLEAGNAAYLLEPATVVTTTGFEGVEAQDTVLAFVGKV